MRANEEDMTNPAAKCHPDAPIFRYKVLRGVLYVNEQDAHNMSAYSGE